MANPSRYDQRITIKRRVETLGADGSRSVVFTDLCERYAGVKVESGTEGEAQSQPSATQSTTFEVRACPVTNTVYASDALVWKGSQYEITSVIPLPAGRPDILRITAATRADNLLTAPAA